VLAHLVFHFAQLPYRQPASEIGPPQSGVRVAFH
jgi:hypothetical protein